MKKYFIIAFILIFLCLFCIKSPAFGKDLKYDFYINQNTIIQNFKNNIDNNKPCLNESISFMPEIFNNYKKELYLFIK